MKDVLDRFVPTDSRLLGITTDNASSNYLMTRELQSTLEASAIKSPGLRNHIPCMAHVIQLDLGAFMCSLSVKSLTKSWEAQERDQQFGENESIDIGKSQRLRKESNARTNKVSAMKLGLAMIIEIVRISWYFESPEIDLHIAENACCIDYTDSWSSRRVYWMSQSQNTDCGTPDYGCEVTLEFNTGVAWAGLLTMEIHTQVAPQSKIHWLPVTFNNSRWVDHCDVCHGSIEAISILDPVDVKGAYSHIASRYHSVQWHVQSYWWCDVSFGSEED